MSVEISNERPIEEVAVQSPATTGDRVRAVIGFVLFLLIWLIAIAVAILMILNLSISEESVADTALRDVATGPQPGLFSDISLTDGEALQVPEAQPYDFGVIHHRTLSIQNQSDGAMTYYAGLDRLMAAGNTPPKERVVSAAQRLNGYEIELAELKKNLPAGSEVRGGLAIDRIAGSVGAYRRALDAAFKYLASGDRAEISVVSESLAEAQRLRRLGLKALNAENARVSDSGYYDARSSEFAEHLSSTR